MALGLTKNPDLFSRRSFIGGSDARIIMGNDEAALVRLWREKRGEASGRHRSDQDRPQAVERHPHR
jgi:predicted phage-related endonuclease